MEMLFERFGKGSGVGKTALQRDIRYGFVNFESKPAEVLGNELSLPELSQDETLRLKAIHCEQHFTEPPPRYSEASLIKTLEERGIGRPSTYASIIATLKQREYVVIDNKRFKPTDVGRVVNRFLTEHFAKYVDYDFTANLEDDLDAVSRGEKEWIPLMKSFWKPFKKLVDQQLQLTQVCR